MSRTVKIINIMKIDSGSGANFVRQIIHETAPSSL